MKQGSDDILERHIIYIHPINQSYEKMITFMKRQAVASLIILNKKKTNKSNKNHSTIVFFLQKVTIIRKVYCLKRFLQYIKKWILRSTSILATSFFVKVKLFQELQTLLCFSLFKIQRLGYFTVARSTLLYPLQIDI